MLTLLRPAARAPDPIGRWLRLRALAVAGPVAAGLDGDLGLVRIPLPSGASGGAVGRYADARAIALSPDGRWLAVGLRDRVARLHWPSGEIDDEDPVSTPVHSVAIDNAGRRAAGCVDGRVWVDGPSGWGAFEAHEKRVAAVARRGDRVVSADIDGRVVWVGLASGAGQVHELEREVTSLLLESGAGVFIGGRCGRLWRWRPEREELSPLARFDGPITALSPQADGVVAAHGTLSVWTEDMGVAGVWPAHRGDVLGMGRGDGDHLWTAARGEGLRCHDPNAPGPRPPFHGHRSGVRALLPVGSAIWTAGRDGALRRWSRAGDLQATRRRGRAGLQRLLQLPDGRLLVGDTAGSLSRLTADGRPDGAPVSAHQGPLTALGWLPSAGLVVTGGADGALRVWDPGTLLPVVERRDHEDRVRCLAVLDGGRLVTGSYDHTLAVAPALGGPVEARLEGHERPVLAVCPLPNGLLSASLDGTVRRWSLAGAAEAVVSVDPAGLVGLVPGPAGLWFALGKSGRVSVVTAQATVQGSVTLDAPGDGAAWVEDRLLVGDQRGGVHVLGLA